MWTCDKILFTDLCENTEGSKETIKCDLCERNVSSENRLKIHKAEWHTNVFPMYEGRLTRQLGRNEEYDLQCLVCEKDFLLEGGTRQGSPVDNRPSTD